MSAPRRNVELKATDPDPDRTLRVALGLGARDEGVLRQRDTYFRVARGRLKLREQEPGGARLVQYERPDGSHARASDYRIVPVEDPTALGAALDAALGTLAVVKKTRRLLLHGAVRIHLDSVSGLGSFVELEGVAGADPDLARAAEQVQRLTEALGIAPERALPGSYADLAGGAAGLVRCAREVMARAYAPYSGLRVGAALRAADGSIHTGANVENAAFPEGFCAETSAIGALVAAGQRRITEVAVVCDGDKPCPPCGGCRQRLGELAAPAAVVHLGAGEAFETTTLAALLPRAFDAELLRR